MSFIKNWFLKWFGKQCDRCEEYSFYWERCGDKIYCLECADVVFIECDECHRKVKVSNTKQDDYGDRYCENCYDTMNREFQNIKLSYSKSSSTFRKNKFKEYCGVEIECINRERDKHSFIRKELKELLFCQGVDGSIEDDNGRGVEFRSLPCNGDRLITQIETFCEELKKKEYYVNSTCGLHIHLETPDNDVELLKKLYLFYSKYEKQFFNMLPSSRRDNEYCAKFKKVDDYDYNKVDEVQTLSQFKTLYYDTNYYTSQQNFHIHDKRYCWVNFHSLFYRGTLEIRAHSGTINSEKIINWLLIHLNIIKFLKKTSLGKLKGMKQTDAEFLKVFPSNIQKYVNKRWNNFKQYGYREEERFQYV